MKTTINILLAGAILALTAAPLAAAPSPDGFIYGTVTTRSGNTYEGFLRWDTEEAFWDDLFHSSKEELPYGEHAVESEDEDRDESWWEVFGRKVQIKVGSTPSRVFICRFGDISKIEVTGSNAARLTMRSGAVFDVSGYANDVGSKIAVRDADLGDVDLKWKKIDTIEFKAAPQSADPGARRLHGTMVTDSGEFTGVIQWDSQEALSTDRLDGESDDGTLSVEMGRISTIERRSRKSSRVVFADGREVVLEGTNDVNAEIRGILVEDARYGRVKVSWDSFERLDFSTSDASGTGYGDYPKRGGLRGTVTSADGAKHSGELVFDMDEAESWEMLNGSSFDIEYNIPFHMVASIVPKGSSAVVVTLNNGEDLRLEDSQDVTARNDGVLVKAAGAADPAVIAWEDVRRIDFK